MKQSSWFSRIVREVVRIVGGHEQSRHLAWESAHSGQPYPGRTDPYRVPRVPPQTLRVEDALANEENVQLACACYQAFIDKDRAAIEALLDDDFRFTSPYDNRIDRKTYFDRCWPQSERISGFDFVHLAADGDSVFVTYEAEEINGTRFRNTEVMTIRNGRIREVEVYFGWSVPHQARRGGFLGR